MKRIILIMGMEPLRTAITLITFPGKTGYEEVYSYSSELTDETTKLMHRIRVGQGQILIIAAVGTREVVGVEVAAKQNAQTDLKLKT